MDTAGLFEWFAQESVRIAGQAKEPRQHEMCLRLAFMWAAAGQQCRCEAALAGQAASASS
jgi:hypothetical protein